MRFVKKQVCPSGLNVAPDSSSSVEMIFFANNTGASILFDEALLGIDGPGPFKMQTIVTDKNAGFHIAEKLQCKIQLRGDNQATAYPR